jgi:4-O-dimethylallyl-L-tyrosine synthase
MVTTATQANGNKVGPPQVPLQLSFENAWESLSKWFPPRSAAGDWWWQVMGSHLETLLSCADYSLADQSEALLFLYHWVAPRMGPKPLGPEAEWQSFMTDDYSPVEYSWKWGGGDSAPEVRYSIEPIGHLAGTARDPLNQKATCEFLTQLHRSGLQGLNLEWFEHFKHALLGPGTPAARSTVANQSTLFMAFEICNGPVGVKAYYIPVEAPDNSAGDQISRAIATAGCPNLEAIDELHRFLRDDTYGQTISPFMLGIDCISPAESRLKIYSRSPITSFDFVKHVMSLGGRRQGLDAAEKQLRDLWRLTLGLPDDFDADEQLAREAHQTAGVLFYFDVAPKSKLPDVKLYIPVRHYAPSDAVAANGLVQFLQAQGQGAFTSRYLEVLDSLATPDGMSKDKGVQTYITCAYKKGQLVITSYLNPQFYHPSWF